MKNYALINFFIEKLHLEFCYFNHGPFKAVINSCH